MKCLSKSYIEKHLELCGTTSYTHMILVTCTLDANSGITGGAGLMGVTKLAPASLRYAAGVIVSPSMPRALSYAPRRMPVAF
eukprot:12739917-Ditylum_brightwellii.AAC.1